MRDYNELLLELTNKTIEQMDRGLKYPNNLRVLSAMMLWLSEIPGASSEPLLTQCSIYCKDNLGRKLYQYAGKVVHENKYQDLQELEELVLLKYHIQKIIPDVLLD